MFDGVEIPISRDLYSFNVRGTIQEGCNITSWAILYHEKDKGRLDDTLKQLANEFFGLGWTHVEQPFYIEVTGRANADNYIRTLEETAA